MPDDGTHQHHLYFGPHKPRSLDLISCLRFPIIITPSLCVQSLSSSLALALIVCAYYFSAFNPFRCVYFPPDFSSLFIFPPFDRCSHNLVLSYLHPFTTPLIELIPPFFPSPFTSPSIYVRGTSEKITKNPGSVVVFSFGISGRIRIPLLCCWDLC